MTLALQDGKTAEGLETAQAQIDLLDGMDPVEQKQMLIEALGDAEQGAAQTLRLHDAWRRGDERPAVAGDRRADEARLPAAVPTHRPWSATRPGCRRLEQRLKDDGGDTLVVVGALHLLGPDGVVDGLRARGYKVERICASCKPARSR